MSKNKILKDNLEVIGEKEYDAKKIIKNVNPLTQKIEISKKAAYDGTSYTDVFKERMDTQQ